MRRAATLAVGILVLSGAVCGQAKKATLTLGDYVRQAWQASLLCKCEQGFRLERIGGKLSVVWAERGSSRRIDVRADAFTIALYHTHILGEDPHPSMADVEVAKTAKIPVYVISLGRLAFVVQPTGEVDDLQR